MFMREAYWLQPYRSMLLFEKETSEPRFQSIMLKIREARISY